MKKIMALFLTLALLIATGTTGVYADPGNGNSKFKAFKDIRGNWGENSIIKMHEMGMLTGYEDGTFRPEKKLSQLEVAVIIDRLVEKKEGIVYEELEDTDGDQEESLLKNVPGWAKKSYLKGIKNKYINVNRYHSQVQCDRLLVVIQLAKALKLKPVDPEDFDSNPFNFNDRYLISDEDYGYLLALYNAGYIKGYPNGNFNPNYLISRVQMAKLIDNILNNDDLDFSDEEPPVWPTGSGITASGITSNSVALSWSRAEDNVGVSLYKITYKDGSDKIKYSNDNSETINGLTPNKEFTFTVYGRDATGNWSLPGPSVIVKTLEIPQVTITAISAIIGEVMVGKELEVGALTPDNAIAEFQWMICDTQDGEYENIDDAITNKYTPTEENVGKFLKVSATGIDGYVGTVISEATVSIAIAEEESE